MRGIDRLFERWCRRGDARALEALFDRAAPRLLRLGVHLVGDAAEAEDLVQAVFVALIEQRERIDAGRPAWPWLSAVLAHKASDAKRRAAREVDWEQLEQRLAEDASAPSERRELAAELARAIDRIDEPYRQPLVLRLRHGLNAAEIAHALGRSPATVRVQLHRARELLRPLLPASLATGLALLGASPRGLAAVKGAVLSEAALSGAVASAASVSFLGVGVTLVSQKIVVGALALIALVALVSLWPKEPAPVEAGPVVPGSAGVVEAPPTPAVEPSPSRPSTAGDLARAVADEAPARGVRGRVLDAETGAPVEGARVRLFAPHEAPMLELLRERPELFRSQTNGSLRARDYADWPRLAEVTPRARFGREPVRAYCPPPAGAAPLAEALSDANGRFLLLAGEEGGVLTCEHAGYGDRVRAAHDIEREWDVALWRERTLEGVVLTDRHEPPDAPIRLAFSSVRMPPPPPMSELEQRGSITIADESIECLGVWTVDCGPDGSFSLPVVGEKVHASVLTPGWAIRMRGTHPVDQPMRLFVEPVPVLRIFDAGSGVPIERVRLLGRESVSGYVRWSGEFDAPGGLLELPGADIILMSWGEDATSLTVWAEGYSEARLAFAELGTVGVHDVPLERGGVPSIAGTVRRGASAAGGAEVALLGHSPMQWRHDEDTLVDADRADAGGGFRLSAPAGQYLLRVDHDGTRAFELVELPADASIDLDLDGTGRVDVLVAEETGAPRAEHTVVLRGDDGRSIWGKTDAEGRHAFEDLPPQGYRVVAPFQATEGSFGADLLESFELARGEQREVLLELPVFDGPRHVRVHATGVASYADWRARYGGLDWEPVGADGTLAQDLATVQGVLEVDAPDGRRWSTRVPRAAPDGELIELIHGTGSYSGVARDGQGDPLRGWRVFTTASDAEYAHHVVASVLTDSAGRFELRGLHGGEHSLTLRDKADRSYDFSMSGHTFVPDEPARHAPHLELELPTGLEPTTLRGVVLTEAGREPKHDYIIWVESRVPVEAGTFRIHSERYPGYTRTDVEGRFELQVPDTPAFELRVYSEWKQGGMVLERTFEGATEEPIELLVP